MRRTSLFVLSSVAITLAGCGPRVDLASEEAALRARSAELVAHEGRKDADQAITYWAEDAFAQPPGAPAAQGKAAVRALYGQFFGEPSFKGIEGTPTRFVLAASGDLAYEYGVNRMTFTTPSGDMVDVGKYVVLWRKVNGTWMVAGLAFSSDAPPPDMAAAATPAKGAMPAGKSAAPAKKPM